MVATVVLLRMGKMNGCPSGGVVGSRYAKLALKGWQRDLAGNDEGRFEKKVAMTRVESFDFGAQVSKVPPSNSVPTTRAPSYWDSADSLHDLTRKVLGIQSVRLVTYFLADEHEPR